MYTLPGNKEKIVFTVIVVSLCLLFLVITKKEVRTLEGYLLHGWERIDFVEDLSDRSTAYSVSLEDLSEMNRKILDDRLEYVEELYSSDAHWARIKAIKRPYKGSGGDNYKFELEILEILEISDTPTHVSFD